MNIKEALHKLDPQDLTLWTTEGLPLVQAVETLVGHTVTRKEVTDALPGFSRALALKNADNPVQTNVANTTPATTTEDAVQGSTVALTEQATNEDTLQQTEPDEVADASGDENVDPTLGDVLQAQTKNLQEKRLAKNKADQELKGAQQAYDSALVEFENSELSNHTENPIQAYLAAQVKSAEDRKARQDVIRESGLNLKELVKNLAGSPLDQSLAQKRK